VLFNVFHCLVECPAEVRAVRQGEKMREARLRGEVNDAPCLEGVRPRCAHPAARARLELLFRLNKAPVRTRA
jgi:hypothetical protein